jgi:hypothetical protein
MSAEFSNSAWHNNLRKRPSALTITPLNQREESQSIALFARGWTIRPGQRPTRQVLTYLALFLRFFVANKSTLGDHRKRGGFATKFDTEFSTRYRLFTPWRTWQPPPGRSA